MKTKRFLRLLCLALLLVLLLALAVTAYAEEAGEADPADPQESAVPALAVAYKNLSYSSNIYVMYAVSYDNVAVSNDIQMLFWDAPQTNGYLYGTQSYAVTDSRVEVINGRNHRIFYSNGVAPKELVDNQYCRAYLRVDGVDYYSEVLKFSPLSYIKTITEMTRASEADRNLAAALRAYGHYAQIRFNYKLDDLALEPHYDITLTNAVLDDGFPYGLYKEGTALTLTAVIPEGDSVVRWIDGSGTQLGTDATLTYTITEDSSVRAVLASEPDSCDHVYGDWIAAAEPTCTEEGTVGHYHCELCGRNFDAQYAVIEDPVVIPSLGHEWVNVEALAPSCLPGHTAYHYCSRCDAQEGYEELAATDPHSYEKTVVEPAGERRGYTEHICSVCGDSYRTDYDYSLYSGVNFSDEGKFAIPYAFDGDVYTIEVSTYLPPQHSARAGVLVGNYDTGTRGMNLEIYTGGRPRLFFSANAAGTTTRKTYDYVFSTDIRGEEIKNLAVVIDMTAHSAKLYVDGVFMEEKELGDFDMPTIGRTMVLGGDNRSGNSQSFKGMIYSASIFRDVRTEEELVNDLVIADASDQNCCVSYNLLDPGSLTGGVSLDNIQEYAQVTTAEELAYHASHGTKNIEVMNDITIDRTIYVISDVTIYANGDYTLLRDPDFYSDMFVIGENAAGRNLILDGITCVLDLGKADATGTLTVDGNKENVTGEVFGSLIYINNSGTLNLHDRGVLTNNQKTGNARSLAMEQYFANMVGGAAILNVNGTVNMDGGVISGNEVNFNNPSTDNTSEEYLQSCYGGAVFNYSNFVMTGGTISGNSGYYGGAISNFLQCSLEGGLLENNFSSHAGGAVYVYNSDTRVLKVGSEGAPADSIIFRGNYNTESSGGAIYSGAQGSVLLLGGATFDGNHVPGSGGAIYIGSLSVMEGANSFVNNSAGSRGGALFLTAPTTDRRSISVEDASFSGNHAADGGAIGIVGADVTLTNCAFNENAADKAQSSRAGAISVNRLNDGNVGADVTITGGSFSQNSASSEAGALFGDLNCAITVNGASFTGNTAGTSGGAISVHGVEDLSLTNVTASGNTAGTAGGALYLSYRTVTDNSDPENPVDTKYDTSATVTNCTLSDNTATDVGGAITIYSGNTGASILTMSGTTVSGNTTASSGGAMYVYNGAVTLSGNTFTGNSATKNGGAIMAVSHSSITLTDTTATANTAGLNGGFADVSNSTLTMSATSGHRNAIGDLTDSAKGNTASSGGAIYAENSAVVNVSGADFDYNSTTGSGGALYFNSATGTVSNCTVSHSTGGSAGGDSYGGAMMVGYGSNVTVSDSAFSDNTATVWAGAIYTRRKDATDTTPAVGSTLTLTNTSFTNNSSTRAGAVYVNHSCSLSASGCTFTGNSATVEGGGAIFVDSSGSVDAAGCTFTGNSATTGAGGAIYSSAAPVTISGTTLRQNTAGTTGGAIYMYTNGTLTATDDCLFDQNTSVGIGGALYCNSANATLTDTDFTNNATTGNEAWYGGAVYTNGSSQLRVTRCEFTGNSNPCGSGGAICARGSGLLDITGSSFTNNTAKGTGGAVHVFGTVTATITDTDFTDNSSASTGGAVMVGKDAGDSVFLTLTGGTFSGNNAVSGGAIGMKSGMRLDVNGTTFSGNTAGASGGGAFFAEANATLNLEDAAFTGNSTSGSGGAIYAKEGVAATITDTGFTNNSAGYGGAMILYGANVTLDGGAISGNSVSANGYGGAIYLRQGADSEAGTLNVTDTAFSGNTGTTGAAIYVNTNATLTATNASFSGNGSATATNDGGAIYVNSGGVLDLTGGTFYQNATKNSGGAIYLNGTATAAMDGTTFDGNQASLYGGAIYMNGSTQATVANCLFQNNTNTANRGGAIVVRGTTAALTVTGSAFSQNSAKEGGAIHVFESATATVSDTTFTGNSATNSGGAIEVGRSDQTTPTSDTASLTLTGCTLTSNSSANGGAVWINRYCSLAATDTSFVTNNATGTGGALYSYVDSTTESVTLNGCTFNGNTATGNGGAIYHSSNTIMSWTNVTVRNNSTSARGDAVYVTNGSGKTTTFTIYSATFDQPNRPCIDIGNSGTSVIVHKPGVTDVNHDPVDYSLIITGSSNYATTKVTYEET